MTEYAADGSPIQSRGSGGWIKWVVGGCGCLVLALVALGFGTFFIVKKLTAEAESKTDQFIELCHGGKLQDAYDMFSPELKKVQSFDDFSQGVVSQPQLFDIKSKTYTTRSVKNDRYSFEGTADLANGQKADISFEYVKTDSGLVMNAYSIKIK